MARHKKDEALDIPEALSGIREGMVKIQKVFNTLSETVNAEAPLYDISRLKDHVEAYCQSVEALSNAHNGARESLEQNVQKAATALRVETSEFESWVLEMPEDIPEENLKSSINAINAISHALRNAACGMCGVVSAIQDQLNLKETFPGTCVTSVHTTGHAECPAKDCAR